MLNEVIPKKWNYEPPKTCNKKKVKLFTPEKSYNENRVNSTSLLMPMVKTDIKYLNKLLGLSAQKKLPDSWSWRKYGTNKIEKGGLRDQGECGGCWAFAVASALGDRYSLKYNIESPYPSSTWLISNASPPEIESNESCIKGGNTYLASEWLEQDGNGVKLEQCWPYSIIRNKNYTNPEPLEQLPSDCCFNCCNNIYTKELSSILLTCEKGSTKYLVDGVKVNPAILDSEPIINEKSTIEIIKSEIYNYGPVVSSFFVYDDFKNYWIKDAPDGEIYIRKSDVKIGGHAVVITGWGNDDGIDFWEIRNSWGNTGDKGYCKIAMSTSTPKNKWVCIDIPKYKGQWIGGVISFTPGKLKNKKFFKPGEKYKTEEEKNNEKKIKEENKKKEKEEKINVNNKKKKLEEEKVVKTNKIFNIFIITLAVFAVIFLIYKLLIKHKNNNSFYPSFYKKPDITLNKPALSYSTYQELYKPPKITLDNSRLLPY